MTRHARLSIIGAALASAIAALALPALGSPDEPAPGQGRILTLDPTTGHLAGQIPTGASVADVARRIAEVAQVELEIRGDLGTLRDPVSLNGLSIEAALKRIAPNRSLVVTYVPVEAASGSAPSAPIRRIIKKIVFGSGTLVERLRPESDPTPAEEPVDPEVARAISVREVVALSYSADRNAIVKLREIAAGAEDPAARRAALSALAGVAGHRNLDIFVRSGLADGDSSVRIEAARGIVRLMGDRGRSIVEAAARREAHADARDTMERLARGETVERAATRLSAGFRH